MAKEVPKWKVGLNRYIAITDMKTSHLLNVMNHLELVARYNAEPLPALHGQMKKELESRGEG